MSATETKSPAFTATLLRVSEPAAGVVVISTAAKVLAGLSWRSLKEYSGVVNVCAPSSLTVTVLLAPDGASFTPVTLIVIVLGRSEERRVGKEWRPLSWTWKVKEA